MPKPTRCKTTAQTNPEEVEILVKGYLVIVLALAILIAPSLAATTLTTSQFGALSNPTGDPIGGGTGYSSIYTAGDYTVTTAAQLQTALTSTIGTTTRKIIYIPDTADINLTGIYGLAVPGNVTIASDRGYNGNSGGRLFRIQLSADPGLDNSYRNESTLWINGNNTRITGLRLQGDNMTTLQGNVDQSQTRYGITICPEDWRNTTIDNNEIFGWSGSAILSNTYHNINPTVGLSTAKIGSSILYIHHNYLHHNQQDGLGYSVAIYRNASALIEGNVFDYTRHAIASDGYINTGYEANYNIHLGHSTDHLFDVHRDQYDNPYAGTLFRVTHNTARVGYPGTNAQPWSVVVRSIPTSGYYISANDFPFTTYWGSVQAANHDSPVNQANWDGTGNVFMTNNLVNGTYNQTGPIKICAQANVDDFSCGYT